MRRPATKSSNKQSFKACKRTLWSKTSKEWCSCESRNAKTKSSKEMPFQVYVPQWGLKRSKATWHCTTYTSSRRRQSKDGAPWQRETTKSVLTWSSKELPSSIDLTWPNRCLLCAICSCSEPSDQSCSMLTNAKSLSLTSRSAHTQSTWDSKERHSMLCALTRPKDSKRKSRRKSRDSWSSVDGLPTCRGSLRVKN